MSTVVTVLRSGGDFLPWHVQMMQRQVEKYSPADTEFVCLSDCDIQGVRTIPLEHNWPGWWSKLELFDPRLGLGTFTYTDLDNVILGPLDLILNVPTGYTCQREGWTALMHIPLQRASTSEQSLWDVFVEDPEYWMWKYANRSRTPYGDAGFINEFLPDATHWEDMLAGQVVNVAEILTPLGPRMHKLPMSARVLLCGGEKRRPWKLPGFRRLYGEDV